MRFPLNVCGVRRVPTTANVYRIPSEVFDADICGHAEKGVKVRIHDADVTQRQPYAMVDLVGDDMDRWDGRFELYTVGLDGTGHAVFGVDDRAKAEPLLKKAYGKFWAKHILVEHTGEPRLD